jgi:type IV pilus assembly protein PilA
MLVRMRTYVCRPFFESRSERGYSLIELMIVMSIISILTSISTPQYVNYAVRARWSDNLVRVGQLKMAIAQCAQFNNHRVDATTCNDVAFLIANAFLPLGYEPPGPSAAGGSAPYMAMPVTVGSAAPAEIVITGTANTALGCVVAMTPTVTSSAVTWNYSNSGAAGCGRIRTGVGT